MGFKVIKNTLPSGLEATKAEVKKRMVTGMKNAIEVVRSNVVPLTPRVTGRLVNSLQGFTDEKIEKVETTGTSVIGYIGTKVPYAKKVEFTSRKNKYYFLRGFNNAKENVKRIFKAVITSL